MSLGLIFKYNLKSSVSRVLFIYLLLLFNFLKYGLVLEKMRGSGCKLK